MKRVCGGLPQVAWTLFHLGVEGLHHPTTADDALSPCLPPLPDRPWVWPQPSGGRDHDVVIQEDEQQGSSSSDLRPGAGVW